MASITLTNMRSLDWGHAFPTLYNLNTLWPPHHSVTSPSLCHKGSFPPPSRNLPLSPPLLVALTKYLAFDRHMWIFADRVNTWMRSEWGGWLSPYKHKTTHALKDIHFITRDLWQDCSGNGGAGMGVVLHYFPLRAHFYFLSFFFFLLKLLFLLYFLSLLHGFLVFPFFSI